MFNPCNVFMKLIWTNQKFKTTPCTMEWTVNVLLSTKFYCRYFAIFWLDWQWNKYFLWLLTCTSNTRLKISCENVGQQKTEMWFHKEFDYIVYLGVTENLPIFWLLMQFCFWPNIFMYVSRISITQLDVVCMYCVHWKLESLNSLLKCFLVLSGKTTGTKFYF